MEVDLIFDKETMDLPQSVTKLENDSTDYYIVGTAHISEKSVQDVEAVIDAVQPDVVCVELCKARYDALVDEDRWKKLDIFKVIREGKFLFLLANLAIGAYQRRLGEELGVMPGAEMVAAIKKAEASGARVELIDRDINVTLKRTWSNLGFFDKMKLMGAIMGSLVSQESVEAADIEKLKESDHLSEMMDEFARVMPAVKEPLIVERDLYLISSTEAVGGEKVVAVVGAGHVPGMKEHFGTDIDRDAINVIPPRKSWVGMLKWIIPALILAAFAYGLNKHGGENVEDMIRAWVLPNAIACSIMTTLAGGKLLSILTAFVASPITSLNPLLGAGMVVGLVEAWQRKPTVEDCERINADVKSLKGVYKNPFTRVLLVAVMANIGSAIGGWIGLGWVSSIVTS